MLIVVLLLGVAPGLKAEESTPAWPAGARAAANVASYAPVVAELALDTVHAWRAEDRRRALVVEGLRVGVVVGASELVKRAVGRPRPDGSDRFSFWSEHTALAASAGGWSLQASIPLTFSAGYLRIAADKHHPSDVVVGAVVGGLAARFIR